MPAPIELSHFVAVGMNLAVALCPTDTLVGVFLSRVPPCSWPVESTGQGILNAATQDTNTTYWFMPIDHESLEISGHLGDLSKCAVFQFCDIQARGLLIDTLFDSDIVPTAAAVTHSRSRRAVGRKGTATQ